MNVTTNNVSLNNLTNLTFPLKKRMDEISKSAAMEIDPKNGSTVAFLQFYVKAGEEEVKKLKRAAEDKKSANNEMYAHKVAQERNQPIDAELNEAIKAIKENVRNHVNSKLDARVKQIRTFEVLPMRESRKELLHTITELLNMGYNPSEHEWNLWGEQFAGNALEEKYFETLAETKDITIITSFDAEKSIERLELFRQMANIAINNLENDDNLTAASFLKISKDSPIGKLIEEIDSDISSIIPAERLTLLQRLKAAKEHAYDKDNVQLSVKIGSFIDKNIDRLASPAEVNEALYAEAEQFISQGMTATRE